MAYDNTTEILHIQPNVEKFDFVLDNIAKALGDYRIANINGVTTRDVGTLCTSPKINKWSKYKPFRGSSASVPSDQDFINANFGLNIPEIHGHPSELETLYNRDDNGWEYLAPRGITFKEYYRVMDFDGYYHKAKNPVMSVIAPSSVSVKISNNFGVTMVVPPLDSVKNGVDLRLIRHVKDMYFGILLLNSKNSRILTETKTLAQNGNTITFPTSNLPLGTYKLIPFLSAYQYTNETNNVIGDFITIPAPAGQVFSLDVNDLDKYTLTVVSFKDGYTTNGDGILRYDFTLRNVALTTNQIKNNVLMVRHRGKLITDPLERDEVSLTLPDFDVPIGTSLNYKEWLDNGKPIVIKRLPSIHVPKSLFDAQMEVWVSLAGGLCVSKVTPMTSEGPNI